MLTLIRLYIDSVLVGLALAIPFMVLLVLTDIAGMRQVALTSPEGSRAMMRIVVFFGGLFSCIQFAVTLVRRELAEDRAIERRKREGWGRSPRDRKR